MTWTNEKVERLKFLHNKGKTAREIAEDLGPGFTRNSVIGKSHRLQLSAKIKNRKLIYNPQINGDRLEKTPQKRSRKSRFRSLLLDKNFEPAKNLNLEQLTENTCKYMEGHPNEKESSFCGRKTIEKFSYCPLHLMIVFQPKGKKDELTDKDDEVPKFIEKKIKSA